MRMAKLKDFMKPRNQARYKAILKLAARQEGVTRHEAIAALGSPNSTVDAMLKRLLDEDRALTYTFEARSLSAWRGVSCQKEVRVYRLAKIGAPLP